MGKALSRCLAASHCLLVVAACKPGGTASSGNEAGNVFTLSPGIYTFVKANLREGKGATKAEPVFADGGTGKTLHVTRGETAGSLLLTDTGKYVWRMPGEKPVNVDCTAGQDTLGFEIYSVVEGVGRIGNFKAKRGCRLDPEPAARPQWRGVSLTPQVDGRFVLESEADADGKHFILAETFARAKPE